MRQTAPQDIPVLAIDNVTKCYNQWMRSSKVCDIVKNLTHSEKREILALDHLSLMIRPRELVAYAGSNETRKSTTIRLLSGMLQPIERKISVFGMSPVVDRIPLMERISVLFGRRTELWWDHPVITSFEWKKQVWNIPDSVYEGDPAMMTELLDLKEILHTFARELSLEQRMRAGIGMLPLHSPSVVFLDEPILRLDVLAKQQMMWFLKQLSEEADITIIITDHDMDDLEEMVRWIILLDKGKIQFDGSFEMLRVVTGGFGHLSITFREEGCEIPGLRLLQNQEPADGPDDSGRSVTAEYEFSGKETGIYETLGFLPRYPDVIDVEIRKASIKDVIAGLYLN